MPKIIGLLQSKGGVGKTTTAINLAAEFIRRGQSAVIIDADPSQSAYLVGADGKLAFDVKALPLEATDTKSLVRWREAIANEQADFVIIDAPGSLGASFGATLGISDLVLIPSGATVLDVRGAADTVTIVRRHRRATGRLTPEILVVPSRIDKRTGAGREAVSTLASLTEPVAPPISYRAIVADALAVGEAVPDDSDSSGEFSSLATAVLIRLGVE